MKVIFVCTGNTCRSPMAEHLFRDILRRRDIEGVEVASAGVSARAGQPPARQTAAVLTEEGIGSIESHQSRPLSALTLEPGDLVLTMTRSHLNRLGELPEGVTADTLAGYAGESGQISDPYGQPVEVYRELFEQLQPLLETVADRVEDEIQ